VGAVIFSPPEARAGLIPPPTPSDYDEINLIPGLDDRAP